MSSRSTRSFRARARRWVCWGLGDGCWWSSPNAPPPSQVTLLVGEPVDMGALLEPHRREATEDHVVRKEVTDHLAKVLWGLSVEARDLHQRRL